MEYWCHVCKRECQVVEGNQLACFQCRSPFVEELENQDDDPRNFRPYQPTPSFGQILAELLLSPSTRTYFHLADSEPNLDNIIHTIMQNDPNSYGPPPASQSAISSLRRTLITKELKTERGRLVTKVDECGYRWGEDESVLECPVCTEELKCDDEALEMPCLHLFHSSCLLPWLNTHNNCPVCRFQLPTDDPDYEQRRFGRSI